MHPNNNRGAGAGGRPTTTSWVQMSETGPPTLAGPTYRAPIEQPRSVSLSSQTTASSTASMASSGSGSGGGHHGGHSPALVDSYSRGSSGPNSFVGSTNKAAFGAHSTSLQMIEQLQQATIASSSSSNSGDYHPHHQQLGQSSNIASTVTGSATAAITAATATLPTATATVVDEEQQQEENRKLRLQLYVFVLRCISYSFNAKPNNANDIHHRQQQLKLRKQQLEQIIQLHTRHIKSPSSFAPNKNPHQHLKLAPAFLKQLDELYERAQVSFNRKFLQNERLRLLVESECCSQQDLRDLFRQNAEQILKESKVFSSANQASMLAMQTITMPTTQAFSSANTTTTAAGGSSVTGSGGGSHKGSLRLSSGSRAAANSSSSSSTGDPSYDPSGRGNPVNSLLTSKEIVLNSWLMKFEAIIREDSEGGDFGGATTLGASSVASQASALNYSSSGNSLACQATSAAAGGQQLPNGPNQQQQPTLSKEQLYQMFQNILNIKKFEHQLLYNALQLDSTDEQAAAVRRELDGRITRIAELERNKKLMPKFVLKEMESLYLEEARMSVNKLMVNLDSLPVMKGSSSESRGVYGLQKFRRYNNSPMISEKLRRANKLDDLRRKYPVSCFLLSRAQQPLWSLTHNSVSNFGKIAAQASLTREGLVESHPSEPALTKLDVVLTFNIEVIVMEVRGLRQLAPNREIYCTMEIEGSERLQTEHVQAKKPLWDTQGDFTTNHPLPVLKIKLYAVNPSMLSLEDKELGKLVLRPTVLSPKTPEWCTMQPSSPSLSGVASSLSGSAGASGGAGTASSGAQSEADQELKIRVSVRMDRPQQLKHCGYLYGIGKSTWRKLKRRYHILIQVSQYTFVMCSYRDKKAKPTEMLQLEGYTVDYIEPPTDLIMEHCSEITSNEHHHSQASHSTPLGLAGRLANVILKQPSPLGGGGSSGISLGGGGSLSGAGSTTLGATSGHAGSGGDADGLGLGGANMDEDGNEQQQQQPSAIQTAAALSDELHNKFYFNVVKEGDSVVFACDDEQECFGWVMALYRATGQAHKPTPLRNQYSGTTSHYIDAAFAYNASANQQTKLVGNAIGPSSSSVHCSSGLGSISSLLNGAKMGGSSSKSCVDVADQRARKHGMDEFISADPCKFQHNQLFKYLQNETLKYRLNDAFCSLGWFSPGQVVVLDEYCARYGVRTCFRHLAYLNSLLDFNLRGYFIDHTLLNYGYDFCASHVSGNSGQAHPLGTVNFDLRPDGIGTVTVEERDMFHLIKNKLLKMIERQIANFSYCFPFGKPDGALKTALSLLERVLMKEQQTNSMLQNEEVRSLIRKCLEQAALNNYTKLSGQANLLPGAAANNSNNMAMATSACATGSSSSSYQQVYGEQHGQFALGSSAGASPAASASCSPVPQGLEAAATDHYNYQSAGQEHLQSQSVASRLRTASNLSSSSLGSYNSSQSAASATLSSSTTGTGNPVAAATTANDSFRRRTAGVGVANLSTNSLPPLEQQQQQPASSSQSTKKCLTMAMIINNEHIKPKDKLRYLTRLAELCCEQVEEDNEYFGDAFAWHSDLMMDHFELFWSLFSVDMDKVLTELGGGSYNPAGIQANQPQQQQQQQQAGGQSGPSSFNSQAIRSVATAAVAASGDLLGAGNREVFALFQILNNHMRKSPNLECSKFKAYLCDTFKPKLLRYIDIMESTLTRMLFKACEKDGQINCQLIEQMFVKLEDLQRFILYQLRWPDDPLAEQLHQRLKLISYELCDACVARTLQAFQQVERKSNKWSATTTSYTSPVDMIQMINLVLETRNRSLKLCTFNNFDQMSYHSKIDRAVESALGEMQPGLMSKMLCALESTLTKLARYDEGNLFAPILSLTYKQGMSSSGRDIGRQYVTFVSSCCDSLRHKINDELWIVNLLEEWYAAQMNIICTWLAERIDRSMHDVQLVALTNIMPKVYADMSLQGVSEDKLNLKTYQTVMSRLKMEEAAALAGGSLFEQPSTSIFNTSILSSLTSSSSGHQQQSPPSANMTTTTVTTAPMQTGAATTTGGGNPLTPLRQQQQQQQQQRTESPTIQLRQKFKPSNSAAGPGGLLNNNDGSLDQQFAGQNNPDSNDNLADRAFQSATRMFKGFWAN